MPLIIFIIQFQHVSVTRTNKNICLRNYRIMMITMYACEMLNLSVLRYL
jgi:hypothetical protein